MLDQDNFSFIHTSLPERVYLLYSNIEVAVVVLCAKCGKTDFSARCNAFIGGATRGKPCVSLLSYPQIPYRPQSTHRIHSTSPQMVDKKGISAALILQRWSNKNYAIRFFTSAITDANELSPPIISSTRLQALMAVVWSFLSNSVLMRL